MLAFALLMACRSEVASAPQPPPASSFSCATAAADLGHPDATVVECSEERVLRGLFTVVLDAPGDKVVSFVAATNGERLHTGSTAFARFLRNSALWTSPDVSAWEIRTALLAFDAWPPGFGPTNGPRTLAEDGSPIRLKLPDLEVTLEQPLARWERARGAAVRKGGVRPGDTVRAVLRGGPTTPLTWTFSTVEGGVVLETLPLESLPTLP